MLGCGLHARTEPIKYREGSSQSAQTINVPRLKVNSAVIPKRGLMPNDNAFFQWYNTVRAGTVEKRDVVVSLLNDENEPVMLWKLHEAWPVAIEAPTFSAMASEVAIETLELAHGGISVETV